MYDAEIKKASEKYGVDESTIRGIIQTESNFNPSFTSTSGSNGLMGLTKNISRIMGVSNPLDAAQNIDAGTRYFAILEENSNGDLNRALQKFNGTELDSITYAESVKNNGTAGIENESAGIIGYDKTNFIGDIFVIIICIILFVLAFICIFKAFGIEIPMP